MSSVSKALALLSLFTPARPEIGLSQLCRIAGRDKATTYRHLQALESAYFVEQNPLTKAYRLGPAILHLASMRERTVPRKEAARTAIAALAERTGETAHVAVLTDETMYHLAACESRNHATRAIIDLTEFPLHATASGIVALAFGPERLLEFALADLKGYTPATPTTEPTLQSQIDRARETGFGKSQRTFEDDIAGIAAPIFDQSGLLAGAVAVASVTSRYDERLENQIMTSLVEAARELTHAWGGAVPAHVLSAWEATAPGQTLVEPLI